MAKRKSKSAEKTGAPRKGPAGGDAGSQQETLPAESIPDWFTITDVEQLKSLANDFRLKILRELAQQPHTAKQVAEILGEPATKLYHHFDALAEAGLIRLVGEAPKRGTTQRFYRAVATRFRVDEGFLGNAPEDEKTKTLLGMLDSMRREIVNAANAASDHSDKELPVAAISSLIRTTPERMAELTQQLTEKYADLGEEYSVKPGADGKATSYRITILIHPASD